VKVQGDGITVTKLGTDFSVTYEKRPNNPHLTMTQSRLDANVSLPTISEFREAFQAAVAKARELGWIV
jgi:hypothetical protein